MSKFRDVFSAFICVASNRESMLMSRFSTLFNNAITVGFEGGICVATVALTEGGYISFGAHSWPIVVAGTICEFIGSTVEGACIGIKASYAAVTNPAGAIREFIALLVAKIVGVDSGASRSVGYGRATGDLRKEQTGNLSVFFTADFGRMSLTWNKIEAC